MAAAREFASVHGGRFHVFGSAAEDRMKYDSDFDVVVDFPLPTEMEAAEFVEEACRRRNIPSDIHFRSRASARFLDRIRDSMMSLHERLPLVRCRRRHRSGSPAFWHGG
jgi:predicted nucleotidyltransferase